MARVLFHHLVCMFSLLCAKQKFVAVHIILWGVKAAFNGERAQHSCVLCLWYSLLSQVSGAAFRGTQRPFALRQSAPWLPKRVLIRGQQSAGGLFTLQCRLQFWKGGADKLSSTASLSVLTRFSPLIPPEQPARKEAVVVKYSASFLCTSSVSSLGKTETDLGIVLSVVILQRQPLWFILLHTCAAQVWVSAFWLIHSCPPHTHQLFKVFTRRTYWSCYWAHFFLFPLYTG